MTVKALKKQLMAAIAMVVVALIALSSSTYAWFANNTSVQAKGLTVNAKSDSVLLKIAGKEDTTYSDFKTIGTTVLTNTEMKPTTSWDGKNFAVLSDAVKVESVSAAAATWSGADGAFQATDLVTKASDADDYTFYVATARYDLKCETGSVSNVYVKNITASVTPTDNKTISHSLRVSVSCGETTLVFNPLSGSYLEGGAGKLTNNTWSLATLTPASVGSSAIIASTIGETPSVVTVRVWFEGQDSTCYTNNVDSANISITLEFATDSATVSN